MAEHYDDLSQEELEELLELELELAQAEAEDDELAPEPPIDVDVDPGEEVLEDWQQTVDDFGGRIGSPVKANLTKQLSQGQLGQIILLKTSEPLGFAFPESVLLAEVALKEAVDFDVAFEYDNLFPPAGGTNSSIFQGDGFIRLTWGVPGSFQHQAAIDGNFGWRHSFAASFLRVEYVLIDPRGSKPLKSGQTRDLGVGASITPSRGAANSELTKTFTIKDMTSPDSAIGAIPRWSKNVRFVGNFENPDAEWTLFLIAQDNGVPRVMSTVRSTANVDEWASGQNIDRCFTVPQGATIWILLTLGAAGMGAVENPSLIFGLAL